jgi:hypothetical protein
VIQAWLRDLESLRALSQRYARAADERDIDALRSLFHPEAMVNGARGKQTIAEWLEAMAGPKAFPISMHVLAPPLIDLAEGAEAGTMDTYAVVHQIGDDSSMTLGIRYLDDVVRHDGRWVVKARTATTLWMK